MPVALLRHPATRVLLIATAAAGAARTGLLDTLKSAHAEAPREDPSA